MSHFFPTSAELSRHQIFPGVNISTCSGEHMMLSFVELEPHSVVAEHSHPHEQVGMVLSGRAVFLSAMRKKPSSKGTCTVFPATSATRWWFLINQSRRWTSSIPSARNIGNRLGQGKNSFSIHVWVAITRNCIFQPELLIRHKPLLDKTLCQNRRRGNSFQGFSPRNVFC